MGKGTGEGKKIMRKQIDRSKKQIIRKITPKPGKTKIRIRREK